MASSSCTSTRRHRLGRAWPGHSRQRGRRPHEKRSLSAWHRWARPARTSGTSATRTRRCRRAWAKRRVGVSIFSELQSLQARVRTQFKDRRLRDSVNWRDVDGARDIEALLPNLLQRVAGKRGAIRAVGRRSTRKSGMQSSPSDWRIRTDGTVLNGACSSTHCSPRLEFSRTAKDPARMHVPCCF